MSGQGYPSLPTALTRGIEDTAKALQRAAVVINGILGGKQNIRTTITLANGAATTTITDPRIGANSHFSLRALTANAAAIQASVWVSSQGKQTVTFTHTNTANADQNFSLSITG